ncbi:hypothetical protein LBMAG24_14030 [Bacteroidota bacterium]|nr:hypothetical protein LBMAG24_14030 [Bacteroidota bacterium]
MKAAVERRKLHLIEEFLNISNETIIAKIESLLREERLKILEKQLKTPYSEKEFIEMIGSAENDAKEGKVISSKDLKEQIQSWK